MDHRKIALLCYENSVAPSDENITALSQTTNLSPATVAGLLNPKNTLSFNAEQGPWWNGLNETDANNK